MPNCRYCPGDITRVKSETLNDKWDKYKEYGNPCLVLFSTIEHDKEYIYYLSTICKTNIDQNNSNYISLQHLKLDCLVDISTVYKTRAKNATIAAMNLHRHYFPIIDQIISVNEDKTDTESIKVIKMLKYLKSNQTTATTVLEDRDAEIYNNIKLNLVKPHDLDEQDKDRIGLKLTRKERCVYQEKKETEILKSLANF